MVVIKMWKDCIVVSGHANSAPKGHDLVCAGVSAVLMSSVNWFKKEDIDLNIDEKTPEITLKLTNASKDNIKLIKLIAKQLIALQNNHQENISIKKYK